MGTIRIILIILALIITGDLRADSWRDPTWRNMLESSDEVALVKYISNGSDRAKARIITSYKGQLKCGDEIWVSGFSNRYGPHDKMHKGDTYLVFLKFLPPRESWIEDYEEELKKHPRMKSYVQAYKDGKCYGVWSPTAGDLKVEKELIQYDMIQTTFYSKQSYYSFKEFNRFLNAYYNQDKRQEFCSEMLSKIKQINESDSNTQYLMFLVFLGYNQDELVFESYSKVSNPSSKYALAQLMGNIKSSKALNILIELLNDKHSIVQGEAVRQLKMESPEIVGPILLKHLQTASGDNYGPGIMNPVRNSIDGGKVEIIRALGEMKYKPSIPYLLPLLETDNEDQFELVINSLRIIGSKDYTKYINKHLENKSRRLIFEISNIIVKDSLIECLPSLKQFISTCNRNDHPTYDYTVSACCGLGNFKSQETFEFISNDFNRFYEYKDTLDHFKQIHWIDEYLETFTSWENPTMRPLAFKAIYDWFGYNEAFAKRPELFDIKRCAEDSFKMVFQKVANNFKLNKVICYIAVDDSISIGSPLNLTFMIEVSTGGNKDFETIRSNLSQKLNTPINNIYLVSRDNSYYPRQNEKFDWKEYSTPIMYALDYLDKVPVATDIAFLEGILSANIIEEDFNKDEVKKRISSLKERFLP